MAKGRNPVRIALFGYLTAMLATYGYATYGYLPADELNLADHALVLIVAWSASPCSSATGCADLDRLDFLLKTVVAAGAVVAVIGACQFLFDLDLTRLLRLPILEFTSEDAAVLEREELRRVAATTGHPIEFGVVCAMLLPIAAHYGFQRPRAGRGRGRWGCTLLIAMGLMFSVSRSAMLGLAGVPWCSCSAGPRGGGCARSPRPAGSSSRCGCSSPACSAPSTACSPTSAPTTASGTAPTTTRWPPRRSPATPGSAAASPPGTRPSTRSSTTSTSCPRSSPA